MKIFFVFCAVFLCWTIVDASVEIPPDPAHGTAYCIDFVWNIICKVQCENGYTPEKEHASFYEYNKVTNEWTSGGDEFPWADCV